MKLPALFALFASTLIATAAPEKKGPPDLAFAQTWIANAKQLIGKEVSTCILEVSDVGNVASTAPCVVVPVTTGNAKAESGGNILALVPLADTQAFIENATSIAAGRNSQFGNKAIRAVTKGTLASIEGEVVLVIGPTIPNLGGKKPSELLAGQLGKK